MPIANRVEPGKRPRSSMAPTIVMKDGAPVLAVGSPGGSRIIAMSTNAIIAHLDWGMDVQQAVALPHAVNRFGTYDIEEGTGIAGLQPALTEMGFEVEVRRADFRSARDCNRRRLRGGADPRREGIALGE